MIGVIFLFFWAWPQPEFRSANVMVDEGSPAMERQAASDKFRHSLRAGIGLGFIFIGYGLQLWVVLAQGRPVLSPPQPESKDGNE